MPQQNTHVDHYNSIQDPIRISGWVTLDHLLTFIAILFTIEQKALVLVGINNNATVLTAGTILEVKRATDNNPVQNT